MALRLRPRDAWEALDLGIALVRSRWRPIYGAWLAVYVPATIGAHALLWESPLWAWLLLWWLKPLFDRVVLEVLSGTLFDEPLEIGRLLRSLPATLWRSGIAGALLWRRFDLARSLHLPVYQLERLKGGAARARVRVLDREGRGAAVWLTVMLANVEIILALAVSLTIALLTPVQAPIETLFESWARGQFNGDSGARLGAILGALAVCATEPIYVACGFTLYLQRRTHLEGWDIELRFRQLAARIAEASRAAATSIAASLVLAIALAAAPAHDARAEQAAAPKVDPAAEIANILKDPQFGHSETRNRIKFIGPRWQPGPSEPTDFSWIEALGRFLAEISRGAAWTAGAIAIAFALYYLAKYVRVHGFGPVRRARPDFLFGMDVRPESLPDDVAGVALDLAQAGRLREALSLLYRGCLVRFIEEGIEFQKGDTEGDCTRRVDAAAAPGRRAYFRRIVDSWQELAYGHFAVTNERVTRLAREWNAHFAADAAEPGAGAVPQAS